MVVSVHGDDFTVIGAKNQVDWFEQTLNNTYEMKCVGRLGPGEKDDKEITVLDRVIRWTQKGLEYEADPRQSEKLLEEFELDDGCNTAATPGLKSLPQQLEADKPLCVDDMVQTRNSFLPHAGFARCSAGLKQ